MSNRLETLPRPQWLALNDGPQDPSRVGRGVRVELIPTAGNSLACWPTIPTIPLGIQNIDLVHVELDALLLFGILELERTDLDDES